MVVIMYNHHQCSYSNYFCVHSQSSEHSSTLRKCTTYEKQYSTKKIMAFENTSFKETEFISSF